MPPLMQGTALSEPAAGSKYTTWLSSAGLDHDPFTFEINAETLVGYSGQKRALLEAIISGEKVILLTGPTGSGKTTVLFWLTDTLAREEFRIIYFAKPPADAAEMLDIFNSEFEYGLIFRKRARSLSELPKLIAKVKNHAKNPLGTRSVRGARSGQKIGQRIILFCDEAHEADDEILEWLRVLADQVPGMTLVLAALPRFETHLVQRLETLRKRITSKIELLSLTKEEAAELIQRRIAAAGGRLAFSGDATEYIYEQTAGFPREILRLCSTAIRKAAEAGIYEIRRELLAKEPEKEKEHAFIEITGIPDKQRKLLELLQQPLTPTALAERLQSTYPTKQHALRAVNNLLRRLQQAGLVEREHSEKTFVYKLAPKARTAFVTR